MLWPTLFPVAAMRPLPLALSLLALLPLAAQADEPVRPKVDSRQCGFSTPYNVLVDTGGVWLYRDEGSPREVFFHDGELSVDRKVRTVSDADAQRLRQLEYQAYALMPEVAGLARDSVNVTFDALSGVVEAMTGSKRKARKVDDFRIEAIAHVDMTLGRGRWDQEVFDENFEAKIEDAAESMASMIGRSALWSVFTGRAEQLEARADKMDRELEQMLEVRTKAIEARADGLCLQVRAINDVQSALEYRHDGAPLRLLEVTGDASDKRDADTVAAHH